MIGGTVIETIILPDKVWVNCTDKSNNDECAIYVENTPQARCISFGDSFWWQGRHAMWTAKDSKGNVIAGPDYKLNRIGYSGVKRPNVTNPTNLGKR